ncbi:uncharacterized protein LOC116299733 [Actinia tenebrosa]|uniref:Uncharacterized protein LOC116299733 n=1 Tax=Actinia tenebrosa TaxID=6105 RepID=A0A6P8IAS0_ACTTE|nr:uncharacterized protein LOC116299733 [Actinia tenebrosa]
MSVPNIYPIQTTNGKVLKVYCDMTSEQGMVWTLIESFALSAKKKYKAAPLTMDFPSNEENPPNWSDYRLSRNTMQHVKRDATHWRASCNYDKDRLMKTDYIRGRLSEMDILTYLGGFTCARVEYINVRGISCQNCTTHFRQTSVLHAFVDSGYGLNIGCQWNGRHGAVRYWCDNFGRYDIINPAHRCPSSLSSTTQWWLGKEV